MEPAQTVQSIFQNGSSTTTTEQFTQAMARIIAVLAQTSDPMPETDA